MAKPEVIERSDSGADTMIEEDRDVERTRPALSARDLLSPQPSDGAVDPLNWPLWLKVLLRNLLPHWADLVPDHHLGTDLASSGHWWTKHGFHQPCPWPHGRRVRYQQGKGFVPNVRCQYCTSHAIADPRLSTVCIALNGVAPWLWIPLANKYGRRPIYLGTTLLGFASILGCAYAKTFTQLLVARVFNGLFPVAFALGAQTVSDLFFYHQRGRALGFYTVTMTTGSHLAPIVGGLLGQYCGWRYEVFLHGMK